MMKKKIYFKKMHRVIGMLIITFLASSAALSQSLPVYMELATWKLTDNSREFRASLMAETDEGEVPAEGLNVNFYQMLEDDHELIAQKKTDASGIASAKLPADFDFFKDEDGYINILAEFEGTDAYDAAEAELAFQDVILNIEFVEEDGEKLIYYSGKILMPEDTLPLADNDLYFFVPRMFNDMMVADGWFEENGAGYSDFPVDIIGDSAGKVKVIARITDHWDFGNVEKAAISSWAVPKHAVHREGPHRELWTPIAPRWMIITLIIMLAGVWGHYLYAIYELYMIRKLGKKAEKKS